eukprot:scaffold53460_cov67-Phaeocystis_antarctica.AAC.2
MRAVSPSVFGAAPRARVAGLPGPPPGSPALCAHAGGVGSSCRSRAACCASSRARSCSWPRAGCTRPAGPCRRRRAARRARRAGAAGTSWSPRVDPTSAARCHGSLEKSRPAAPRACTGWRGCGSTT